MQMMNTIQYRLDCHILESLHAENRLSKRFPIGVEELILDWDMDEVKRFHRTHYTPTNAMLYIIGDLNAKSTEALIKNTFETLSSEHKDYDQIMQRSFEIQQQAKVQVEWGKGRPGYQFPPDQLGPLGEKIEPNIKLQSMHFPPVLHRWVGGEYDQSYAVPASNVDLTSTVAGAVIRSKPEALGDVSLDKILKDPSNMLSASINDAMQKLQQPTPEFFPKSPYNVGLFHHQALQAFTFHIFAKRPIEPINDMEALRMGIARRVAITALQVRLGMMGKAQQDVQFSFLGFEVADCPREGCNVASLDLSCDGVQWQKAVEVGVMEVRRFGLYGITESEMNQYMQALLTDSAQVAALGTQGAIPHAELMERMKESVACHHTWMSTADAHAACEKAMAEVTKEDVDKEAYDLTKFIVDFGKLEGEPLPSAIVCGIPPPLNLSDATVIQAIKDGLSIPVEPKADVVTPPSLMTPDMVAGLTAEHPPAWADSGPVKDEFTGTIARKLANGINVSYMPLTHEPGRGFLRIIAPGGRICERGPCGCGAKPGAASIGALTLQDGGTFEPWTREQIELFMMLNLIQWQIQCTDDCLAIDLSFSTTPTGDTAISGLETVLQFINRVLTPGKYTWEEDAFERAKSYLVQAHDQQVCSVEGAATETLMQFAANHDNRFTTLTREELEQVTLEEAKEVTLLQLNPSALDVAIVGDIDIQETERLVLQYLGTVPQSDPKVQAEAKALIMNEARAPAPAPALVRQLKVEVADSDARAVGYLSGPAPNRWGILQDGRHIRDAVAELAPEGSYSSVAARAAAASDSFEREGIKQLTSSPAAGQADRWGHPLFAPVVLAVLQEVVSSRLFQAVRDRKQLTYDTNFRFTGYERMDGSYWVTYVTAQPEKVDLALEACEAVLHDLGRMGAATLNVVPARRTVLKQHEKEVRNNEYWASLLAGTQSDAWPLKQLGDLKDFYGLVDSVTAGDLVALVKIIGLADEKQRYSCIGVSGGGGTDSGAPAPPADGTSHTLPGVPGRSGLSATAGVAGVRFAFLLGPFAAVGFFVAVVLRSRAPARLARGRTPLLSTSRL
jgi:predicted Zn-dependent peptidase